MGRVENNGKTTRKRPGGVTGKGFVPGKSGNPGGRPKKRPISDRYERIAETLLPKKLLIRLKLSPGATYGDALAMAQIQAAINGRTDAARDIREAIEGKATQRHEVTGAEGEPVQVDTQLSCDKLVKALREVYGLEPAASPQEVAASEREQT